jgi:hypothetical protein
VRKSKLKRALLPTIIALAMSTIQAIPAHSAPPATPTITSVVESTNAAYDAGTLTVNWDAVANATSYSAMLTKQNSADAPVVITNEDATQRQATFRGLRGGTVYIVQLKAFTGVEASAWSTNTRTAIPKTFPKAPAKPTVVKGIGRATVSWTALLVAERGGYDVSAYIVSKVGTTTKVEVSGTATEAIVTGLSNGTSYTFNVIATNALGNSAPSISSSFITIFAIGASYQGGKLAYLFIPGNPGYVVGETHGLIAAALDQGYGKYWNGGPINGSIFTGAIGTTIGTGSSNTDKIITAQGAAATSYVAGIARAYRGGGYTDWYLPSKDELHKLYINRVAIGGFFTQKYWSSSALHYGIHSAWDQDFINGSTNGDYNDSRYRVRAVRTF